MGQPSEERGSVTRDFLTKNLEVSCCLGSTASGAFPWSRRDPQVAFLLFVLQYTIKSMPLNVMLHIVFRYCTKETEIKKGGLHRNNHTFW